jgi:hypothetical protein
MNIQRRISGRRGGWPRRLTFGFVLTALLAGGVLFGANGRALAGDRRTICWEKVYVRNYPQGRAWAQLYRNQTFEVYEYRASGWARGRAGGQLRTDKSPYQKPYDNVWIQVAAFCSK